MNSEAIVWLYGMMIAMVAIIIVSSIALIVLRKRQKRKRNFSLNVNGADRSDVSDMMAEKFRNERFNEE